MRDTKYYIKWATWFKQGTCENAGEFGKGFNYGGPGILDKQGTLDMYEGVKYKQQKEMWLYTITYYIIWAKQSTHGNAGEFGKGFNFGGQGTLGKQGDSALNSHRRYKRQFPLISFYIKITRYIQIPHWQPQKI